MPMTVKLKSVIYAAVGLGLSVLILITYMSAPRMGAVQDVNLNKSISELWSADEREREAAKEVIFQSGQTSVPPLIKLLQDFINDPTPRYVPGREEEARQAEIDYRKLYESGRTEEARDALMKRMNLQPNWRVKRDVCELLGRMRAAQAIPVLFEGMVVGDSPGAEEVVTPPMEALIMIGSPAVPTLLDAIATAETSAAVKMSADESTLSKDARDRLAKLEVFKIKARSAIVLGRIANPDALPDLEKLRTTTSDSFLIPYIDEAIANILKGAVKQNN